MWVLLCFCYSAGWSYIIYGETVGTDPAVRVRPHLWSYRPHAELEFCRMGRVINVWTC